MRETLEISHVLQPTIVKPLIALSTLNYNYIV